MCPPRPPYQLMFCIGKVIGVPVQPEYSIGWPFTQVVGLSSIGLMSLIAFSRIL